jgi:16S rRNA (cytosine967-C5)-methyltransferase
VRASSLVGHVVEVLDSVRAGRRPADAVVREYFRARHYLGASDRRYIAERTFDVLRHHVLLKYYCTEALAATGTHTRMAVLPSIMLAAAYELRCTQDPGTPAEIEGSYAGLWRMFVPDVGCPVFLDALTRVGIPEGMRADPEVFLSLQHSLPRFMVAEWLRRFGGEEAARLCEAMNRPAPVTLRVNTLKCTVEECRLALLREGIEGTPAPLAPSALILKKRINAQGLEAFRRGWFEMQDEGSQLIALVPGVRPGMTVIDACAGGGGKSLHLAALMANAGTIIAADADRSKLTKFEERARRAGVSIARSVAVPPDADPVELRTVAADVVLVDAPCSGSGTLRRSPWLKLALEERAMVSLTRLQRSLLDRYAALVKPGGRLVYATCSVLEAENRVVADAFLREHPLFEPLPLRAAVGAAFPVPPENPEDALELLPHRNGTDGFFAVAMIRKS